MIFIQWLMVYLKHVVSQNIWELQTALHRAGSLHTRLKNNLFSFHSVGFPWRACDENTSARPAQPSPAPVRLKILVIHFPQALPILSRLIEL